MRILRGLINIPPEEEPEEVQFVRLEKRRWRGCVSPFLAPVLRSLLQGEYNQPAFQDHVDWEKLWA